MKHVSVMDFLKCQSNTISDKNKFKKKQKKIFIYSHLDKFDFIRLQLSLKKMINFFLKIFFY